MEHIVKIQTLRWLGKDIFAIEFFLPKINPSPGQFFQVRTGDSYDPFLNRPISIAAYNRGKCLLVIKIRGRGTRLLSEKRPGEELIIYGPFGKGIEKIEDRKAIIIAGGIGVAPLFFLAQHLYKYGIDFTFLYGTKRKEELVLKGNIIRISREAIFVTEMGSRKRATVVSALREINLSDYRIGYACGPKEMLKELKSLSLPFPVYAFCEDFLGCGCGLCLGCAIRYYGKYRRICEDGPVFELKGIEFEE
uniref:FAD-binding FR-type domain-containing protein n=1 Tax=candidate division WOR-3 bacterium TaxID=2052148 RepID=A0A7C4XM60_UNCW3